MDSIMSANNPTVLSCIAVDDEPLALDLIVSYIKRTPYLNLLASFSNSIEALAFLHQNEVNLVFLDISIPGLSGMELARILNTEKQRSPSKIIFTTAYNEYALEGYQVNAMDYLVKPFNYVDFSIAANKGLEYFSLLNKATASAPIEKINPASDEEFIYVKVEYQFVKLAIKDILYIQSLGDYIRIHLKTSDRPVMSLMTLKAFEEKMPASRFMRIHRSYIVALDKIDSVTKNSVQIGKELIPVTEQYKEVFNKYLNQVL
jgi:two-component system response regulator LytT